MTTKKPAPKPLPSPALTADMKHEATPPAKIAEAIALPPVAPVPPPEPPKKARCRCCGNITADRCVVCGNVA